MISAFDKKYKTLNPAQKEAVDSIEGPVMVIAGPGTGKTSILTLRIANILRRTDTPANGILGLTFTESGVHSMRRKLVEYIGAEAYRVPLYTFHGFAQEVISRFPEYFPRIIGGAVASESEKLEIIEEALSEGDFEIIRPFGKPTLYVRKALSVISDLKRDGIAPHAFNALLSKEKAHLLKATDKYHEKGRLKGELKKEYIDDVHNNTKNKELGVLYGAYEKELRRRELYDFEDMLLSLVEGLQKHKNLLRTLQEEYLYVLADEHQDANNSQNTVLELLCDYRDTKNLFIVGDEKQAIYRFQGASLENFLYFRKKFPEAKIISLDTNYRSSQRILDASHALMSSHVDVDPLLRPHLTSASTSARSVHRVEVISYETLADEREGIVSLIADAIKKNEVTPEDIVILARTNSELSDFGRVLAAHQVPFTLFADDDVLADPDMHKLFLLFHAVIFPDRDEYVGGMLLIDFLGIHPIDAVHINRQASGERRSPLEILNSKKHRAILVDEKAAQILSEKFVRWMQCAHNESALDAFLTVVRESGFESYLVGKQDSLQKLAKLAGLYDAIKAFLSTHKDAKLKDFVTSIDRLIRHGSPLKFSRSFVSSGGVSVMTAHKSKGLEWKQVYISNAVDRVWGNRRSIGSFRLPSPLFSAGESETDEDERRLFYVALTRAKEKATITLSHADENGRERLPSRFVEELPPEGIERIEGKAYSGIERFARIVKSTLAMPSLKRQWDREFLEKLFLEQGMNATALNNYLTCPWKYFFKNLIRLPDIPAPYLYFGTSVHAALKAFADARRTGVKFLKKDFFEVFTRTLVRLPITKSDLGRLNKKGKKTLEMYFDARAPHWHDNSLAEYPISGVFLALSDGKQVLLRGRLEKLELLEGRAVHVVDYKTGARRTRNEILGNTKNASGDIKRQLNFYRLLLDLHEKGKYEMVSAGIDFVEPDNKGKLHAPERFFMSPEDALSVQGEVTKVAEEIRSLAFWDQTCDDRECEFCVLRSLVV